MGLKKKHKEIFVWGLTVWVGEKEKGETSLNCTQNDSTF